MPRKTRAAARAQEQDYEIATDETRTDTPDHTVETKADEQQRPALVELTANAVDDIEVAMELKPGNKKASKKTRGTSRKGIKQGKAKESPHNVLQPVEIVEEPTSGSETGRETDITVSAVQSPEGPTEKLDVEQRSTPKLDDPALAVSDPTQQIETEAAQKLESLFKQPETLTEPSPVEELAAVAPRIKDASPTLNTATKVAPKDAKLKSMRVASTRPPPTATKASTLRAKATRKPSATKPRVSTVKTRPSMVSKAPSPTVKARFSTVSPVKKHANDADPSTERKRTNIAALNTPPPPLKSSKPTTTSTFKLPGEALQEKFKVQREERQKRQEEQAQKQKEATIRPTIPPKHTTKPRAVPDVKLNKASAARMSMSNTLKERPNGSMTPAMKRSATVKMSHRPSLSINSGNTVKRPQGHARSVSTASKPDITHPTPQLTAAEKAEAAKRARAEAAERGRLASKAWAEKKQKDLDAKKAVAKATANVESKENTAPVPGAV